jgi:hypothetical protein
MQEKNEGGMEKNRAEEERRRLKALARRLGDTGLVLQGTITERTITREDPGAKGPTRIYGPYYQWTFKEAGKTVTVNLSAAQAKAYQRAIDNNREMEEIIREMRQLSLAICEATTVGVKKRKTKKQAKLSLS